VKGVFRQPGRIVFDAFLFLVSVYLYLLATQFIYVVTPGQLGPDFWPKIILIFLMGLSLYDLVATFWEQPIAPQKEGEAALEKSYPGLLIIGCLLTIGYVYLVPYLGFFLTTFLYLIAFIYTGRYRKRIGVIISTSLLTALLVIIIFVKLVYVSLPPGTGVFAEVTFILYRLLGIR